GGGGASSLPASGTPRPEFPVVLSHPSLGGFTPQGELRPHPAPPGWTLASPRPPPEA
ncbi:mCG1044747, partial [Mus musculus]